MTQRRVRPIYDRCGDSCSTAAQTLGASYRQTLGRQVLAVRSLPERDLLLHCSQ